MYLRPLRGFFTNSSAKHNASNRFTYISVSTNISCQMHLFDFPIVEGLVLMSSVFKRLDKRSSYLKSHKQNIQSSHKKSETGYRPSCFVASPF